MGVFFGMLEGDLELIRADLKNIKEIIDMRKEDWDHRNTADTCWICGGDFKQYSNGHSEGLWKVRDHDHLNGEYRGAAHSKCNQQLRIDAYHTMIPVFFHNLKNFDAHHLISAVGRRDEKTTTSTDKDGVQKMKKDKNGKDTNEPRKVTDGRISAIVQNMEKMISFNDLLQLGQFRFLDSYAFLSSSLDRLVGNTPKEDLRITTRDYPTRSSMARERQQERFELVTGKGIYPYEYMDSFDRFDEDQLPPQSKFYSSLSDEGITDKDYEHAKASGGSATARAWVTITTSTLKQTFTLCLMSSKSFAELLSLPTNWTLLGTTPCQAPPGMPS